MLFRLINTFIATLIILSAGAATFPVTSNADSGPGTLREAITLANANGIGVTDNIFFNLADFTRAGRTITLMSQLPVLTSNIILDGSTQAGADFGISDAKIILQTSETAPVSFFLLSIMNATNVQIYGMYFYNSWWTTFSPPGYPTISGIFFYKSSDIRIGAPGKGNYFRGLFYSICSQLQDINDRYKPNSDNITISSNVIGYNEDGEPNDVTPSTGQVVNMSQYAISFQNVSNIRIGGTTLSEGNFIHANKLEVRESDRTSNDAGLFLFSNNSVVTAADRSTNLAARPLDFWLGNEHPDPLPEYADYTVEMKDNIMRANIRIFSISKPITIQGNILFNYSSDVRDHNLKLHIYGCSGGGTIGGSGAGEPNHFFVEAQSIYTPGPSSNTDELGAILVEHSPRFTMLENTQVCTHLSGSTIRVYLSAEPLIRIDYTEPNFVRGTATPNCKILVYKDDDCLACEGMSYLGQTTSDAAGDWSFNGVFTGVVLATAENQQGTTSGYTEPLVYSENVQLIKAACGRNNGSIKGIVPTGSYTQQEWHMLFIRDGIDRDSIVSTLSDLVDMPPGLYYFQTRMGETCKSRIRLFTLGEVTPSISTTSMTINHPTCGSNNGSITGITTSGMEQSRSFWINEQRDTVGRMEVLTDITQGRFKFIVLDNYHEDCGDSTDWITLTNQGGPNVSTNLTINAATCGLSNGSITGITYTNTSGQVYLEWDNENGQVVGNNVNLQNVPGGRYRLKLKDAAGCDTLYFGYYSVPSVEPAYIAGLLTSTITASCADYLGSISVSSPVLHITFSSFEWRNNEDLVIGNDPAIQVGPAGMYRLFATDTNGCRTMVTSGTIQPAIMPVIDYSRMQVRDDRCSLAEGSITALSVIGNSPGEKFRWTRNGIGYAVSDIPGISGLKSGSYTISTGSNGCVTTSPPIVVGNNEAPVTIRYNNVQVPRNYPAQLNVTNVTPGLYTLYADATALQIIETNRTGNFLTPRNATDKIYYVGMVSGTCSSPLVPVKVTVIDKAFFAIPSAFTPNNDGINDRLVLQVIGITETNYFRVYNRNGELVFATRNIGVGWDGRIKGIEQPSGAYVWMAEGRDFLGNLLRQKGTVVLIR
ncbi:MAG: gliding motility-associated C-terminal domain-containing protein [Chitinophagaceae bacterium]